MGTLAVHGMALAAAFAVSVAVWALVYPSILLIVATAAVLYFGGERAIEAAAGRRA
jgi:hypothetical protein